MNDRENKIIPLCDGLKTSHEIAKLAGDNAKYVQATMKKYNLPRLPQAPRPGINNPSFVCGRVIDRDGYVLVSSPPNHPHSRKKKGRSYGLIYEHRLILEKVLGRYLIPSETVDHIDGIRLHNSEDNLRLFDCNANHLIDTITGRIPKWSKAGIEKMKLSRIEKSNRERIHTYEDMKKSGDARLREILLALLKLGKDSPYLLGTNRYLQKAGISDLSRSNLIHELNLLYQKYE